MTSQGTGSNPNRRSTISTAHAIRKKRNFFLSEESKIFMFFISFDLLSFESGNGQMRAVAGFLRICQFAGCLASACSAFLIAICLWKSSSLPASTKGESTGTGEVM